MSTSMRATSHEVRDTAGSYVLAEAGGEGAPARYKRTEVGVIPEDWQTAKLKQLSAFITKGSTPTTYGFKWERSGIIFLRSECVAEQGLDLAQSMWISPSAHALLRRSEVSDGDILMTITGNVGRVVLLTGVGKANLNQHIARIRITSDASDPGYIFQYLAQLIIRKRLGAITTGQAYPQISLKQVRDLDVALPPIVEQRAIAAVLSDVDELLAKLDQLIAKKRNLKQAAIQSLLTGKRRLPGFTRDWERSTVGHEFDIKLGKMLDSERNRGVLKPYIGNKAVQWGQIDHGDLPLVAMSASDLESYRLRQGDLLVCEGGEVGRAAIWNAPIAECYYQKALHRLRALRGFNPHLMVAFLRYWADHGLLANYVTQTSIAHLTREKFADIPMDIPSVEEQTAIATILSDMDAELAALETRRTKTRELKQGMMQALLTGRIRLT